MPHIYGFTYIDTAFRHLQCCIFYTICIKNCLTYDFYKGESLSTPRIVFPETKTCSKYIFFFLSYTEDTLKALSWIYTYWHFSSHVHADEHRYVEVIWSHFLIHLFKEPLNFITKLQ